MFLATLTDMGRAAMAHAMREMGLTFAWGAGSEDWTEEDLASSLRAETALQHELGRRVPNQVAFVLPDAEGEITLPVGRNPDGSVEQARYRIVDAPSNYLYLRVAFDFAEESAATIREVGVFVGSRAKAECPPGQRYFKPEELENPGLILSIQRLETAIERSPAVRQSFEFVLQI